MNTNLKFSPIHGIGHVATTNAGTWILYREAGSWNLLDSRDGSHSKLECLTLAQAKAYASAVASNGVTVAA